MRIEVRGHEISPSDALQAYAERKFLAALERFGPRVSHVTIRLVDENGLKGGIDKRCFVEATLVRARTVVVDERHPDLYTAVDLVADRVARAVEREIGRRRSKRAEAAEMRAAEKTGQGRPIARAS